MKNVTVLTTGFARVFIRKQLETCDKKMFSLRGGREENLTKMLDKGSKTRAHILSRTSVIAVSAMLAFTPAFAQEAAETSEDDLAMDTVVVTGVKGSLQSAQELKRNADTVVDSITASDLGAFPDKSVAEALQRVPGITVNRFAASSDTAHFSAEPSGVIVRGLQQVRSEFNGRDTFSANSSRGLSWSDISPELLSGVDVYKNQTAELIEGGIAGTVNLRTRVPFDQDGRMIAGSINMNYGDLSEAVTPELSFLVSDRWQTEFGEFGLLANIAHSEVTTASQGIQQFRANAFGGVYDADGDGNAEGVQNADGSWDLDSVLYIPGQLVYRDNTYFRERDGISIAGQWRSNDDKFLLTGQYNRSEYNNVWEEYVVASLPADLSFGQPLDYVVSSATAAPQPAPGTNPFVFDDRGYFQSGTLTSDIGWWGGGDAESALVATNGANGSGSHLINACYGWNGCEPTRRSPDFETQTRYNNQTNVTEDFGLNLKWAPTDRLRFNFDGQYVQSEVDNYDITVGFRSFATPSVDLTGDYPKIDFVDPVNVNYAEGGLANPSNYYYSYIMDHVEESEGEEVALRADGDYDIDSGWIESVKFGARYADRDQTVRWSTYNWQNVVNTWTQNAQYFSINSHDPIADPNSPGANGQSFTGYPTDGYSLRQFGLDGFGSGILNQSLFIFPNIDLLRDRARTAETLSAEGLGLSGGVGWDPICSNTGDRAEEIADTCFRLAEIADVSEETLAGYAQLVFGGDDAQIFGVPVSGNLGVRYVETTVASTGGTAFPRLSEDDLNCAAQTPQGGVAPAVPFTVGCYITAEEVAFANGFDQPSTVDTTFDNILPSFNIRFDLTDEWLLRFAASRAIARPDIGNLRNYLGVDYQLPDNDDASDPLWIKDGDGNIIGAEVRYSADAQNARLKPIVADQFDISLEHYFDDVGSFSMAVFYKKFSDYIQFDTFDVAVTNNGVTRPVRVKGPVNGDGAKIQGIELAYQNFFEELPEPFDGFGVQANYTYVDNQGIANTNIQSQSASGTTLTDQATNSIQVDALEGLSEHSYNLVGMYEKDKLAVRLAYNWRSEYLVTVIDCCVAYSVWNEDTATLDGSIRYRLTDVIELSLQGTNLLSEETVLEQQVRDSDEGGLRLPNATFKNDRRFTAGIRFKF